MTSQELLGTMHKEKQGFFSHVAVSDQDLLVSGLILICKSCVSTFSYSWCLEK